MTSVFKTTLLLGVMTALLMVIGGMLGGSRGVEFALVFAAIMNFGSYWFSDKIVLRAYGAQPLDANSAPELYSIVTELAHEANIPMPRLYMIDMIDTDTPNAFATGRNPNHAAVAVTRGIMRICNRDELKGVIGHELSHVLNHDTLTSSIAATLAGAVMLIGTMVRWGALFGGLGGGDDREGGIGELIVLGLLAPIAASLIQLAISRTREYQADASGAKLTRHPLYLADALRKLEAANERIPMDAAPATAHLFIVNPLSAKGIARLFSTHPPLEERIARLEKMAMAGGQ